MLFHDHVPASYWVDAFSTATYIINWLPTKVLNDHSPFELLYSRLHTYTNLRAFGCLVYPYLRDYSAYKLTLRIIPCIFIGYNPHYKGYKCLDLENSRIYITRHARFDELTFPFSSSKTSIDLDTLKLCSFLDDGSPIQPPPSNDRQASIAPQFADTTHPNDKRPTTTADPCGPCFPSDAPSVSIHHDPP